MNIMLLIILCITSIIHCSDKSNYKKVPIARSKDIGSTTYSHYFVDLPEEIADEAWDFLRYLLPKYHYDVNQLTELSEEMVMNPFWQKMKNESQEKKIETLITILTPLHSDICYLARRYNIAAAVYAGIDFPRLQSMKVPFCTPLLTGIVRKQDYHLTKLLLIHKADIHEKSFEDPIIYYAETVPLARLLIEHGALDFNTVDRDGNTLFHRVMDEGYASGLIDLYKKCGINPRTCNKLQRTPLMEAVTSCRYAKGHMITKTSLLLQGLPKEKAIALINAKDHTGNDIFNIIEKQKQQNASGCKEFAALRCYLALYMLTSVMDE